MPLYMKEANGAKFGFVFCGRTSRDRHSDWEKPSYCQIKKGTITRNTHTYWNNDFIGWFWYVGWVICRSTKKAKRTGKFSLSKISKKKKRYIEI